MPANRNALLRYKTIDTCLQNRFRKWTLEGLIEACSDALYEFEGINKKLSVRTLQLDIQFMRSNKLGYNAPIAVIDRKYYIYSDPKYSITNIPLTDQDLGKMTEAIDILRQFKGFSHFQELTGIIQKLEDKVETQKRKGTPIIQIEINDNLKGLAFIDPLYKYILKGQSIKIDYQSFKARNSDAFNFHPQLLKEYRNRWFVLGFKTAKQYPMILALDRVISIEKGELPYVKNSKHDLENYFKDALGVSIMEGVKPERVELFLERSHAPYILTKPIHHSQKLEKNTAGGIIISLQVQLNFELEKELLGFGEHVTVLSPPRLVKNMKKRVMQVNRLYDKGLHPSMIEAAVKNVKRKGFDILEDIYSPKEVLNISRLINHYFQQNSEEQKFGTRQLLRKIPDLKPLLFNHSLTSLVEEGFGQDYFLTKAIYFDKQPENNWYVAWHQDVPINVKEKIETKGFRAWTFKKGVISVRPPLSILQNIYTIRIHLDDANEENGALKVIAKSHFDILMPKEIESMIMEKASIACNVSAGGINLMKPLTLHASEKSKNEQPRRVIHLEFCSMTLPGELEWGE